MLIGKESWIRKKTRSYFVKLQAIVVGRGNIGYPVAETTVLIWGTVGTRELEEMGIAEQVLAEYEARDEFQDVAEYLVKDGSMCGYLFRCLHCEQYHLWVDAD